MSRNNPFLKMLIEQRLATRRQFLLTSGASFLALPPLLSIMSKTAVAQALATKKVRCVTYVGSFGIDQVQMFPVLDVAAMTPAPGVFSTYYKPLTSFTTPISRMIDPTLAPLYPKMNLMRGLSLTGGKYQGHNCGVLAATHSSQGGNARTPALGRSIDVVIERSPSVYKPSDQVVLKALRIQGSGFSYDYANGIPVRSGSVRGDLGVFQQLFASLQSAGTAPTPAQTQGKVNRKLIVDQAHEDLKALQGNARLSSDDKQVLDSYMTSLFELQQKIAANQNGGGPSCTVPALTMQMTKVGNTYKYPSTTEWGVRDTGLMFDNYIEMIRLAFACDLTRVVHIENGIWQDNPIVPNGDYDFHHRAASSEVAADHHKWGLLKLAKLATRLQATTDPFGGGTLLDNSILLYTNELGAWTTSHSTLALPAITFGSGGGFFKTGNYVDFTQRPTTGLFSGPSPGRPFKQLLQSIMQAMGVPKSEYIKYGDGNGYGDFKVGINQFGKNKPDAFAAYVNEHNDKLPFVT